MSTKAEWETTVTTTAADDLVYIYSANPNHVKKLAADSRVTRVDGDESWGNFTVPSKDYNPLRGLKTRRKPLTDEQKAIIALRLGKARAERATKSVSPL